MQEVLTDTSRDTCPSLWCQHDDRCEDSADAFQLWLYSSDRLTAAAVCTQFCFRRQMLPKVESNKEHLLKYCTYIFRFYCTTFIWQLELLVTSEILHEKTYDELIKSIISESKLNQTWRSSIQFIGSTCLKQSVSSIKSRLQTSLFIFYLGLPLTIIFIIE